MNKKMKHLLLALCVCIFGLMMTGCASETTTTIKVKSATKADFSIQVGYDDELLSAIATMSETTTEDQRYRHIKPVISVSFFCS